MLQEFLKFLESEQNPIVIATAHNFFLFLLTEWLKYEKEE